MGFKANDEAPKNSFMIDAGVYTMMMTESEVKESNSTPGNKYMDCTFVITKGENKGAKLHKMFHCFPAKSSKFADGEIQAVEHLMYLVGVKKLKKDKNWKPMYNKPVNGKVMIEKADKDSQYDDKNIISSRGFTEPSKGGKAKYNSDDDPWSKKKKGKKSKKDKKKKGKKGKKGKK